MEKQPVGPAGISDKFEPLLDSQQAGELMHLHPESVKRLARTGEIVAAKMGGVWRFRVSALEAYMQKITAKTQPQIAENMAPSKPAVDVGAELEKVMSQRTRYQQGMVYRVKRKQGPDCWGFRWRGED